MVEADHVAYLAFGQQVLKLFHGHCVARGIVESEVADLKWRLTYMYIDIKEYIP